MPKIPDATRLQRALPSGQQRVIDISTRDVGAGAQALGAALGTVAGELQKKDLRDRKNTLDDAELSMAIALEKEGRAYDQDPEFDTIGERSDVSMDSILNTIGTDITNAEDREDFANRQRLAIERTRSHLGRVAFGKEREHNRGRINGQLVDAREASMLGDMGLVSELVKRRLDSAVEKNYYTAEEADGLYRKWQTSAATGRLETMAPESRLEALKLPWADKLPSDTRAKYKRAAEKEMLVGKAQGTVDDLMSKELTLDDGMDVIEAKIKDPAERAETERRFKEEYRTQEAADADEQTALYDKHSLVIMEPGGKTDNIPRDEWAVMGTAMRQNLKNMESQQRKPRTQSDPYTFDRLTYLSSRGEWNAMKELISTNGSILTPGHRERFETAMAKGEAPESVTDQEVINGALPGTTYKDLRPMLLIKMNNWHNKFKRIYGKEPSSDQSEAWVRHSILEYDRDPDAWIFTETTKIYDLEGKEQEDALKLVHMTELEEKDPTTFRDTEEYLAAQGVSADRYEFEETFKNQQAVSSIYRRDPDGYSDVEEYFRRTPRPGGRPPSHLDFLLKYRQLGESRRGVNR